MRFGKIAMEVGAEPEKHELDTINFLARLGKNILILAPSRKRGAKTPDIRMDKVEWEIKSPVGRGSNTIRRAFGVAIAQSCYIIFDLRRSTITDERNIARLQKEFNDIKKVKRLLVIPKIGKILDFRK
ncbi:hypothetical protein FWH09_01030 [Candidatus Saccharibacteria bacterium]|nr:hypothetical protein [Candidatus Saccharibacteria bacterium]